MKDDYHQNIIIEPYKLQNLQINLKQEFKNENKKTHKMKNSIKLQKLQNLNINFKQ